jgi:hypothetical protein
MLETERNSDWKKNYFTLQISDTMSYEGIQALKKAKRMILRNKEQVLFFLVIHTRLFLPIKLLSMSYVKLIQKMK